MLALPQEYPSKTSGTPDIIKRHFEIKAAPSSIPRPIEIQNAIKEILAKVINKDAETFKRETAS